MRDCFGSYWPIKLWLLCFAGPTFGWGFIPLVVAIFYWLLLVKEAFISGPRVLELCSPESANSTRPDLTNI